METSHDLRLEVVQVLVTDVERAKDFYADNAGFQVDHDTQLDDLRRLVQLTPPGSACSIVIGTGLSAVQPGSMEGFQLTVTDMDVARSALLDGGVEVSDVEILGRPGHAGFKHAYFRDPDGNAWTVQEICADD